MRTVFGTLIHQLGPEENARRRRVKDLGMGLGRSLNQTIYTGLKVKGGWEISQEWGTQ